MNRTYESTHRSDIGDKYASKQWRINQNEFRDTLIDEYINANVKLGYMITRTYYYEEVNREEVVTHNKRMNAVIDDLFNPRRREEYIIGKKHFIEQHKPSLDKIKPIKVKNTLLDKWELDWNTDIKPGKYHVHSLITEIDDRVIDKPNRKIRKTMQELYGDDPKTDKEEVKTDLLNQSLRKRCQFIGNSAQSMYIQNATKYLMYDGYIGWKGLVAYVTKTMYNVDMIDTVYDNINSTIYK